MGAVFERAGIAPADPLLNTPTEENSGNALGVDGSAGQGRWRIPLGAYHPLMTLLTSESKNWVEGIPIEQLRAATLGRERTEKKFPTVRMLIRREVSPVVASALAPYQRGGVDFILDKEGRVLLADEMGLGKTVQAIAAMSAYRQEDWPLLVLCPSTARYHWEAEFRQWMGSEAKTRLEAEARKKKASDIAFPDNRHADRVDIENAFLKNKQINVLTSGKSPILNSTSTAVVICSFGLIVNLVTSKRMFPGMFNAVIVDESHALKSKSTKRTKAVLPILKAAERCLLLSGTPALARPSELWPQLSCLGRRKGRYDGRGNGDGIETEAKAGGIWCDEKEFADKYVRPKGEENNKAKLAELHTLLTSTVMIRRMKADILKNLPSKIREKAYINITDIKLQCEFRTYMMMLRQGKGVLGKLARAFHADGEVASDVHDAAATATAAASTPHPHFEVKQNKEVLHHLYSITGQSKIARVTKNLVSWLADPSKGKICIFAHHLSVLDAISAGANLSYAKASMNQFIRIDGSTSPKDRQEKILRFQTDPKVRVAMLGITAAGVAVTLTASSTVWFAELFWTPAIMIQAEDRCHRIGQQARVRCLYFIARGTLDEVLWKLIEKKFRDLGAFVEGKENMDIALERELEDGEDDKIVKSEGNEDDVGENSMSCGGLVKKRKAHEVQDVFNEILDAEDPELKKEIDELCHEEEDMLNVKNKEDEEELIERELVTINENKEGVGTGNNIDASATNNTTKKVIELLDDEDDNDGDRSKPPTIANLRELYRSTGIFNSLRVDPRMQLKNMRLYTVQYQGPSYGLIMVSCNARVVVKAQTLEGQAGQSTSLKSETPRIGSIIVAINEHVVPYNAQFVKVLQLMKVMMRSPPVTIMFAEDDAFISMFVEDFVPNIPVHRAPRTTAASTSTSSATAITTVTSATNGNYRHISPSRQQQDSKVIELLDDD